jgi:uncharacterized SAM-binding protein YcdF (DUF218 family)
MSALDTLRAHKGTVWLVTSALHMPRSLAIARSLGIKVRAYPCDFRTLEHPTWRAWLPDHGGPLLWYDALHELVGLAWYRLRGWA